MDVAPCITLQSDMANLFDQYLFKDHNYEPTSTPSNPTMTSEGYTVHNFGNEDLNFQGLHLPPQHQINGGILPSAGTLNEPDHSFADIFTAPILTSMSQPQDGNVQVCSSYNDYVSSSTTSYHNSHVYDAQPVYTTSELKPLSARVHQAAPTRQAASIAQQNDQMMMGSPQHQQIYHTMNHGHISTTNNQHGVTHRFNAIDRRPSSTGSASIGSSPAESIHTSPGRESEDSDDSVPVSQGNIAFAIQNNMRIKRSPEPDDNVPTSTAKAKVVKKPKVQKKKKKRDPNEPQKPVSAYALFFRDTQAAIKGQNPNASFGEVSKIVASMWDGLDIEHKNVYKKKTEAAKKEYLKALAAYRASIVCRTGPEHDLNMNNNIIPRQAAQPQQMSALQKKSPLLTSLMDTNNAGSRQDYVQTTMGIPYNTAKPLLISTSIDAYPSYQPPVYKAPVTMAFQRSQSMPINTYAQQQAVNKNIMSNQMQNPGMMEMQPNPTQTNMSIDSGLPGQPQVMGSMHGTNVVCSSPQQMRGPNAASPNQYVNIPDSQYKFSYPKSWNTGGPITSQYIPTSDGSGAATPYSSRSTTGASGHEQSIRPDSSGAEYGNYSSNNPTQSAYSSQQYNSTNGTSQYDECNSISQSFFKPPASSEFTSEGDMSERGLLQSHC